VKTYALAQESVTVEGGKTEYHYKLQKNDENPMKEIMGLLKKVLEGDGIKAKELLAKSDAQRVEDYERIRKAIGLKASEKEQDVLGIIQMMLQILAKEQE